MSRRIDGGTMTLMAAEREIIFHDALELEQSDREETLLGKQPWRSRITLRHSGGLPIT